MKNYSFSQELRDHSKPLFGTFIHLPSTEIVEIICMTSLNYIIVDLEHGAYGIQGCSSLIQTARGLGKRVIVRVSENNSAEITKALDLGADAVLVPQITTIDEAKKAISAARYAPEGSRGVFPFARAADYGKVHTEDYLKRANEQVAVILLVEGLAALENIDEITKLNGLDGIFLGPFDLSAALGVPGQVNHSLVKMKIDEVLNFSKKSGIAIGIFCADVSNIAFNLKKGFTFIACSVDSNIISNAFENLVKKIQLEAKKVAR